MNSEMKSANQVGKLVWKSFGIDSIRILNVSLAKAMVDQKTTHQIAQLTCQIKSKEAVGVFKGDKCIAGDISTPVMNSELIILEKWLTIEHSDWKIAGKLKSSS
jgi:hypothetical protein